MLLVLCSRHLFVQCDVVENAKGAFALVDFTNATLTEDGSRECVNTTGIMETYDRIPIYECVDKNEEQCHHTYVTEFEPTREEVCEENYQKSCKVI